jgi:tetratricopeptide (TPR) repeat protein
MGQAEKAIDRAKYALALSPVEPFGYFYRTALTLAHYFSGNFEDAVFWGKRTLAMAPNFIGNLRILIAALVAVGRIDEARATGAQLLKVDPQFRVTAFCASYPLKRDDDRRALEAHLSRASLPV